MTERSPSLQRHHEHRLRRRHRTSVRRAGWLPSDTSDRLPRVLELFAHDVRGPLRAARRGLAEARAAAGGVEQLEVVATQLAEVERLVQLLAGDAVPTSADRSEHEVDLGQAVAAILARHHVGRRTVELDVDHGCGAVRSRELARAVEQLVTNAINHTDLGATIWITVRLAPRWCEVVVADDGRGVPGEMREAIFARGERGLAPPSTGGLGLGLYLARAIVEDAGGRLVCEERQGGGAQFRLRVPHRLVRVDVG